MNFKTILFVFFAYSSFCQTVFYGENNISFLKYSDSPLVFKNWVSTNDQEIIDIFSGNAEEMIGQWSHQPSYRYLWISNGNDFALSDFPLIKSEVSLPEITHVYALDYYNGPPPPAFKNDQVSSSVVVPGSGTILPTNTIINRYCYVNFESPNSDNSFFTPFGEDISTKDFHKVFRYKNKSKEKQELELIVNGNPSYEFVEDGSGDTNFNILMDAANSLNPEIIDNIGLIRDGQHATLELSGSSFEYGRMSRRFSVEPGELVFIDCELIAPNLSANLHSFVNVWHPFVLLIDGFEVKRDLFLSGPRDPNHLTLYADTCDIDGKVISVDVNIQFTNEGESAVTDSISVVLPASSLGDLGIENIYNLRTDVPGMVLSSYDVINGKIRIVFTPRSNYIGFGNNDKIGKINFNLPISLSEFLNARDEMYHAEIQFGIMDPWKTGYTMIRSDNCQEVDPQGMSAETDCEKCKKECKCTCEKRSIWERLNCWLFGC